MIIEKVRGFLTSEPDFGYFPELRDDESLIEAGVLDSFSVVKLVVFLESAFGISIGPTDLVEENVATLENIERMVQRKLGQDA